jgi:xylulose-5-phosphate/fructose-6-phosphate phosphoketolase
MHEAMAATLDKAVEQIKKIQQDARAWEFAERPRWPMIVLNRPRVGPGRRRRWLPIEGTFRAHQVPLSDPATNPEHLANAGRLAEELSPEELVRRTGRLKPELAELAPVGERRMGANPSRQWRHACCAICGCRIFATTRKMFLRRVAKASATRMCSGHSCAM